MSYWENMTRIGKYLLQGGILLMLASPPTLATVTINGSFAVPGGLTSGNAGAVQLVTATGAASPAVSVNDRASSHHFLVNQGPARCVTVTVTRTATSEPLVVTFYTSDGMVPDNPSTSNQ